MKTNHTFLPGWPGSSARIFFFMVLLFSLHVDHRAFATIASPDPVDLVQPDGTKISLKIRGDEFFHWFEDDQGFTVVVDANQQYVYANLNAEGQLAPTALIVGQSDPKTTGVARGILPSPEVRDALKTRMLQESSQVLKGAEPPPQIAPSGTVKNLVVLCKFSDHVFGTHTRQQSDYDTIFNRVGGDATLAPTGSVKDYYNETSYGVINLQSTVVAWVTLPNTEAYYADGKDGTGGTYPKNAQGMVKDALNLVDGLVNFAQFDSDNDGYIDAIDIIHSGYGSETGGGGGNWIWSHKWSLSSVPGGKWTSQDTNASGVAVKVYDYHTEPALWGTSGTEILRIGVICHETGHFFGLPDLYDTDQSSEGIGSWCLMANSWGFDGTQRHPPHFSAWCKEQLGWIVPTTITSGTFSVPRAETSATVYKITAGFPSNEYLLIENRQATGFESDIPQGGLAVWHIDNNKSNNKEEGYPGQSGWPTNNKHYKVALLQADGLYEMEHKTNRGNGGDVFRSGGVSAITHSTVPSTDRYQEGIVASTNNSITSISTSSATMSFTLNGSSGIPVITSATSASGTPGTAFNYQIVASNSPTSYNATSLPSGLSVNTGTGLISGTPSAAGVFSVGLSATNGSGTGTATLTLTVATVLTLADALDTPGRTWTTGGNANWASQTNTTQDGQDAAQSGLLGDSQSSYMETVVAGPGTLTFWWKVSSESGYDYLRFMVDGVEQSSVTGISGSVNWQSKTASIASGNHTLRWQYAKDSSVASGSDAGWVDQVVYTPGVQQPVITSVTTASGVRNQAFSYQITATNNPTSYSATGLPTGLSVNASTGLVSGTPTTEGTTNVAMGATNSAGTGTATLVLTISAPALTLAEAVDAPTLTWTTGGNTGWQPQTTTTHDAQDAAQSGTISDSQESWMETSLTGPGTLSFWWKVSSETSYDYLRFTVDGVEQAAIAGISGTVDWQQKTASIAAGSHTLRWRYSKDISVSSGSDAGWVDQVAFSATTSAPEIAVEQPAGTGLNDGSSSVSFGTVVSTANSTRTFTITNLGSLNLTGLGITIDGANPGDFVVTSSPVAPVAPGGSTTFVVRFSPLALGNRAATLHVASNDADENPFDITLTGTGTNPLNAFFDDFDPSYDASLWAAFGGSVEANTNGQAAGAGSTGNSLWFGGDGSRFATTQPIDTRTGGSVSFLIALGNGASSPWEQADAGEEVVLEYSNDGTTFVQSGGPYSNTSWQTVTVPIPVAAQTPDTQFRFRQLSNSGASFDHWAIDDVRIGAVVVTGPEIVVEQPAGSGLTDGAASTSFGSVAVGGSVTLTYTVRNIGNAALTGLVLSKDGANPGDFILGAPGVTSLAAGSSTTFNVTFSPAAVGAKSAGLHLASNDADENPFDIALSGTGLSTNANLSGLTLSSGTLVPAFASTTTTYTASVTNATSSITVTPTKADPSAIIRVNGATVASGTPSGAISLVVGANVITTVVTAQDGTTTKAYTITVSRQPPPADVIAIYNSGTDVPVAANGYTATGKTVTFTLSYAPVTGTTLMVVNNTSLNYIVGTFANLAQNQAVALIYGGVTYRFVANYFGGTGNDLVLQWASNRILTWGRNDYGQLGNGGTTDSLIPQAVTSAGVLAGKTIVAEAVGGFHALALCSDGTLAAWGQNGSGQLGNGSQVQSNVPVAINAFGALAGKTVIAIGAGGSHSIALCSDNTVATWGANGFGQMGNNTVADSWVPVAVGGFGALPGKTVIAVAAGDGHTMVSCSDGTVVAWGYNSNGQLGNNSVANARVPAAVNTTSGLSALFAKTVVAISAGAYHSLALCSDGTVASWGYNASGQLGNNSTTQSQVPVAVNVTSGVSALSGKTVTAVVGAQAHTLALCSDGTLTAWGQNVFGQLGNNSVGQSNVPVGINAFGALATRTVLAIGAGSQHSLALCADGTLAAWGANSYGAVGDNSTATRLLPVVVDASTTTFGERFIEGHSGSRSLGTIGVVATPPPYPIVRTNAATGITGTTAVLNGTVNAVGYTTSVSFEYGLTSAFGVSVAAVPPSATGTNDVAATATLSALAPGTTYHYRLIGVSSEGRANGNEQVFRTPSTNADLASLSLSAGTLSPSFAGGTTSYTANVPNAVASLTVTPVTGDSAATIKVRSNGGSYSQLTSGSPTSPMPLSVGLNTVDIQVTAEDGTTQKTYSVSVSRPPVTPLSAIYNSSGDVPVTASSYTAAGNQVTFTLNYSPVPGTILTVVRNTGPAFITGTFSNLAQGQNVSLIFGSTTYNFVANYYGGTGNDLVLQWASTKLLAWGQNDFGQLGNNSTTNSNVPAPVSAAGVLAGKTITAIAAGGHHTLALCSDGTVAAWGQNASGQLGNNTTTQSNVPVAVNAFGSLAGRLVVAVSAGNFHSLALCSDGTVAAWGANGFGSLGNNTVTDSHVPVQVSNAAGVSALFGKTVVAVSAGSAHSMALCSDGTVAAWGYNGSGQLGSNSTVQANAPVATNIASGVSALFGKTVVVISAGESHCLAACTDGTAAGWGFNSSGQLGNNSTLQSNVPVAINTTSGLSALFGKTVGNIAAAQAHGMALCSDGTLACWGQNVSGQLGNNGVAQSNVAVLVNRVSGVSALFGKTVTGISAGGQHSIALASDGTLATWGANSYGALGDGTTQTRLAPVAVNTAALAPGERFMLGVSGSFASHTLGLVGAIPTATASTLAASSITGTSAVLSGVANPNGTNTSIFFEYGVSTSYGASVAATPASASGFTFTPASATVSGLIPSTIYHFRIYGVNGLGNIYGSDLSFSTLSNDANLSSLTISAGTLSPLFAGGITSYTASVVGAVSSITMTPTTARAGAMIAVRVNGGAYASVSSGAQSGALALNVGSNTLEVLVTAEDGTTTKTYTVTVTRLPSLTSPTVTSPTATSITKTDATLGGTVSSDGGATITERGVVFSATAANSNPLIGGAGVTKITSIGTTGTFASSVTGLTSGTSYTYKAYATNSQGTSYSSTDTFRTLTRMKAQLINPVNGSALSSTLLPLTWNAGQDVTGYALWVGTSAGNYDLYAALETGTSRTVTVPADRRIHVTLWSLISGSYQANYYVFDPVPSAKATLITPADGSTLTGGTLALNWNAGVGGSSYALWLGSSPGTYDLGAASAGMATAWTFTGIPQDGGPVYLTLWSLINGAYQSNCYWFTTALPVSGNRAAILTSPTNASALGSATLNLTWDAGVGAVGYALWVGSTANGYDLYAALETGYSRSVPVPADGRRIYVTLHSLISGAYQSNAYYFTAPTQPDAGAAQVTSPSNGSTLTDATLPLTWSSAAGATQYYLFVGGSPGASDLYAASQGTSLSRTVTGMPLDGRPVHVTLYSWINGAWKTSSTWFTTANTASGNKRALISSPANGTTLPGASTTFAWGGGVGVTQYALWIGSSPGAYDLWASAETSTTTSRTVSTLPTDGRKLHATLYSMIGGAWQGASYQYTAANIAVTKASITSPTPGITLPGTSTTFAWSASNSATVYALWIGRTPGSYDVYAGAEGTSLSRTVNTLPADGGPVYVTIYSLIKGAWQSAEAIYQTASP